jgi:hypothetical protein
MKMEVSAEIPFPRMQVFQIYRDKLPELVKYLPNIRSIAQVSRVEEGNVIKMHNLWKGGGDIPAVVRKFLSEDLLQWDDHATWYSDSVTCDWRTVVPSFKDAVDSAGKNRYDELGPNLTRLTITGHLNVDAKKVKGVPGFLAGTIGPAIEAFLVNSIKPNLISVAKGVGDYLRTNPA